MNRKKRVVEDYEITLMFVDGDESQQQQARCWCAHIPELMTRVYDADPLAAIVAAMREAEAYLAVQSLPTIKIPYAPAAIDQIDVTVQVTA